VARECPSRRTYVAIEDGGYVSTDDIDEDTEEQPASNEGGLSLSIMMQATSGFVLCSAYSVHRWRTLRDCSAITCSRFYSGLKIGVHVSSLMEGAATI
jgi:hypothetical protein